MFRLISGGALSLLALAALLLWPSEAMDGVRAALAVCADVIIPSLFPFFVLGSAVTELGLPQRLGKALSGPMSKLFGVSGAGASAFVIGILGGYPLGASTVSGLVVRGAASRSEGERLLGFCNNSGPAFLVGAAGVGVFGSVRAGMALYACHVLAAVTAGVLMRGKRTSAAVSALHAGDLPEPGALARAVTSSVKNILAVCGFVTVFSAVTAALDASGLLGRLSGELAVRTGMELGASRALLTGFFEIGGGISALRGCSPTRLNFAVCALIIGWGGVSVHMQTASAAAPAKLKAARHFAGRLLSAVFSAAYAFLLWPAAF